LRDAHGIISKPTNASTAAAPGSVSVNTTRDHTYVPFGVLEDVVIVSVPLA
jgi:hypothetical protein